MTPARAAPPASPPLFPHLHVEYPGVGHARLSGPVTAQTINDLVQRRGITLFEFEGAQFGPGVQDALDGWKKHGVEVRAAGRRKKSV